MITPFSMARNIKMQPLAVIFSMLLCVAAFGGLGVLVAAPLGAIVHICHAELYRKLYLPIDYRRPPGFTGNKILVRKVTIPPVWALSTAG